MVLFPNEHNILYPNTSEVLMKKKKPTDTWMQEYTLDERKAKFFEFCAKFDERQDDLLRDDFQIFSHRLHWHEHLSLHWGLRVCHDVINLFGVQSV